MRVPNMHPSELLHHWNEQDALGLEMSASPDQMVAEACLCRSLIKSMWCCLTLKVWHAHSTGLAMESRPQDQGQDRGIWNSSSCQRLNCDLQWTYTSSGMPIYDVDAALGCKEQVLRQKPQLPITLKSIQMGFSCSSE
ncbi:hypothetical protein VitviT2T_003967 [Vitis vinifera]|uniref:Uncharacterized protein n=1 Tax=Vitis vinifera TaxID=29760 RepID=A0ABY9BNM4_VITVI|nr:hypothetical protein VitviT2T_003967 [Vitis vinifera]